jgi:hypothetical protein
MGQIGKRIRITEHPDRDPVPIPLPAPVPECEPVPA